MKIGLTVESRAPRRTELLGLVMVRFTCGHERPVIPEADVQLTPETLADIAAQVCPSCQEWLTDRITRQAIQMRSAGFVGKDVERLVFYAWLVRAGRLTDALPAE